MITFLLQLINVGFFVCLDSFLSLVTIMPTRLLVTTWKHLQARLVLSQVIFLKLKHKYVWSMKINDQ